MRRLCFISCILFLFIYSITSVFCSPVVYLSYKFLASTSFFLIAFFSRRKVLSSEKAYSDRYVKFSFVFLIGFVFCVIGDTLIEVFFIIGMAAFLLAQIAFFTAFLIAKKPSAYCIPLIIGLTLAIGLFEKFQPFVSLGDLYIPLMFYLLFIVANVVFASQFLKKKTLCSRLVFIGLLMFLLSDFELQFPMFSDYERNINLLFGLTNNFVYFPGQMILALSLGEDFIA